MTNFRFAIALLAAVVMAAGCTTVSRQLGSITANKYADARSGTVWIVPPPQLEPPSAADKTVYISYRNISDSDIQLLTLMKDSARDQGWTLVNDPDQATYRLRASTRFFGEVEPESGGASTAKAMGVISGAAVGVGTGYGIARATDSGVAGVVGGAAIGGFAGLGISNASTPREWALIIDVVLEERQSKPVKFDIATDSGSGAKDSAGSGNSRMSTGGGTSRGNTSVATAQRTSNYFPHGVRLSVWANQMNMTEEEALPEIEKRTKRVVTQMLPM